MIDVFIDWCSSENEKKGDPNWYGIDGIFIWTNLCRYFKNWFEWKNVDNDLKWKDLINSVIFSAIKQGGLGGEDEE